MNKSISKLLLAPLTVIILASFAMTPLAEARGGGGARAGGRGGGGARQNAQPSNSMADVRTNDVRNTSISNVNTNVNVNIDQRGGDWDHPVAAAVVVGRAIGVTTAAIGSMVSTVPVECVPVNYGGIVYQQCGDIWYESQGSQFVVVNPPY